MDPAYVPVMFMASHAKTYSARAKRPPSAYLKPMTYLIHAHRPSGDTTLKARTEEAALKIMDRLHYADVAYQGFDSAGAAIDENDLTDIIDARPRRPVAF